MSRLLHRLSPGLLALGLGFGIAAVPTAHAELPPSHRIDQEEICLSCHDLDGELEAAVVHAPAAGGDCSACHNPHVARFEGLLSDRPAILCAECHGELARELAREVTHRPAAEGRCLSCHEPHGGSNGKLLTQVGRDLCSGCHTEIEEWGERATQHSPFRRNQCGRCHEPHAADNPGLLKLAGGQSCFKCHPVTASFQRKHNGYPVERAGCEACHDPHASTGRGLFRESVHAPFADGDCEICHAGPDAADPFALSSPENELCGECHDEQVRASREAPFPHVSAGGGKCTACHNPHAGEGSALLNRGPQATCLKCHDPAGASSGQPGRFATHAEDLECTACHSPHGGERPLLFAADPVEVCSECHDHNHGINHPVGEENPDPRNGMPTDCGSCHGIHHAPFDKYMKADPKRDLCLDCHRVIGGRSR